MAGLFETRGAEPSQRVAIAVIACFWLIGGTTLAQTSPGDLKTSDGRVSAFFTQHCADCHSGDAPEAEFDVTELAPRFDDPVVRARWLSVVEQVEAGNMPPAEHPRPEPADVSWLGDRVRQQVATWQARHQREHGRVVLRRLNRNEYANTLRDLLDIHIDLTDLFPPSTSTSGFDNSAESLHVSTYLLDNYLAAADRALDAAIANGPRPRTVKERHDIRDEKTVAATGSVYRHVDDGVAIFSAAVNANVQVTLWRFMTRAPGRYRFRISGYAYQTDKPVTFHVKVGPMNAAAQQDLIGYFEFTPGEPTVVEFTEHIKARQTIRIVADGLKVRPWNLGDAATYRGPGMVVRWVDVEGPLLESWPPPGHERLFGGMSQRRATADDGQLQVVSDQPMRDAERIMRAFAGRAFRRPVSDADLAPFVARVRAKLEEGHSFEQAVRVGLKAILVAPDFLFLRERYSPTDKGQLLDGYALASRLSYFLWSSMPDDELFALAEQGRLQDAAVLRAQVNRMLRDARASALTENFTGQWLALRAIDDTLPDRLLYPEYDNLLKESMLSEVTLFFEEVLKNDLSLTSFIDSDFTMLNDRLAAHYGIPGVTGIGFRRVPLPPSSPRGGLLTTGAVLKVTANGTTTSPILRGSWVLDRILGMPPPRPTVDVEAVEPDIRGATTIREQLAKHRDIPACATCHRSIDPHGFALENFDVIGGWRTHYRSIGRGRPIEIDGRRMRYREGAEVDASDTLRDGRRFEGVHAYKRLLLSDKDKLAAALASRFVEYATGAAVTLADRAEIDRIVQRVREKDYGLRSLVHEVVQSDVFRHK